MEQQLEAIVNEVVFNKDRYSTYYLQKFGINQPSISRLRSGERKIGNLKYDTIKKILKAYKAKNEQS